MSIAPSSPEAAFENLVSRYDGFELVVYNKYVWTTMGGKDDDIWYIEEHKGENKRTVVRSATKVNGRWQDSCCTIKDGVSTPQDIKSGTTISFITDKLYNGQGQIEESRKSTNSYLMGIFIRKYTFNFGAQAYDVAKPYDVTVGVILKNDDKGTYRMRKLSVGDEVEKPEF